MALVNRVLFLLQNNAALGTVTCGDAVATLPAANLQDPELALPMRTASTTPANTKIRLDQGSAKAVGVVAIPAHNLRSTATVTITVSANSDLSSPTYGPTSHPSYADDAMRRNLFVAILEAQPSARYVGIDLSDSGNPAGYLQAGALAVGPYFQFSRHYIWGHKVQVVDPSEIITTPTGQKFRRAVPKIRQLLITLKYLPAGEALATVIRDIDLLLGTVVDLLVVPNPTVTTHWAKENIWGSQADLEGVSLPDPSGYERSFVFEERA